MVKSGKNSTLPSHCQKQVDQKYYKNLYLFQEFPLQTNLHILNKMC